ncbi:hypothetical protein M422DRAFT_188818, partial [Sphaerobolus stellatus SS14]
LQPAPSPLRPACQVNERLFLWKGLNTPPPSVIDSPMIHLLVDVAHRASLRDTSAYSAGLRKFHLFCDIFSVPEVERLPASFTILHSFALWAVSDPAIIPLPHSGVIFEPVSVTTVKKYLAAVRAWHIVQGWPPLLAESHFTRINWSLRGMANIIGSLRRRPLCPPITVTMLWCLRSILHLSDPFKACLWALATCSFWGMMRLGEVTVPSRASFDPTKHLKRSDVSFDKDLDGRTYARLNLPTAKTAAPGQVQSVCVLANDSLCPVEALLHLSTVVPAGSYPLFSWRDPQGTIRPMVKKTAMAKLNLILVANGFGTAFGHSFRIGGASYYLAQGVSPEIVRIGGRWRSTVYELYIRSFEQVLSRHLPTVIGGRIAVPAPRV